MIRKFLLALMLVVSAVSCVFAQQSTPAPDVKPTILDPVANKRVAEISSQLRCLVCQNQSIADSNAELAMDLKKQVVKQIAEGKSNQQIIRFHSGYFGTLLSARQRKRRISRFDKKSERIGRGSKGE